MSHLIVQLRLQMQKKGEVGTVVDCADAKAKKSGMG